MVTTEERKEVKKGAGKAIKGKVVRMVVASKVVLEVKVKGTMVTVEEVHKLVRIDIYLWILRILV